MEQRYLETRLFQVQKYMLYGCVVLMTGFRYRLLMSGWIGSTLCALLTMLFVAVCITLIFKAEKWLSVQNTNVRNTYTSLLCTVPSVYGLTLLTDTRKSILWVITACFIYAGMKRLLNCESSSKERRASWILALIYSLAVLLGSEADRYDNIILWNTNDYTVHDILLQIVACIGLFTLFTLCLNQLFALIRKPKKQNQEQKTDRRSFLSYFTGIMILWLPYYVAFYPGILDKDSLSEVAQQLGLEVLSNHHPIMHQLFIRAGLQLGVFLRSRNLGVGIHTMMQMLLMAAVFSFCLIRLKERGVSRIARIAVFLFYSVFTVNAFFAITMWKDVLFGGLTLLLSLLLLDLLRGKRQPNWKTWLQLFVVSFLFSTMRNNGYYAFVLGMLGMIILDRKTRKITLTLLISVIVLVTAYQHVLFDVMGIQKSRTAEALSLPIQQIARVVVFTDVDLNDEYFRILQEVFPDIEELKEDYIPIISDGVKHENVFESEVFDENPLRYAKAWVAIGLKHPRAYLEAFLLQNYGYWYPDVDYTIIYPKLRENELGLHETERLEPLRDNLRELTYELSKRQPTSVFYSVGLIAWLLLLSGTALILKDFKRACLPLLILAGLWLTALASPVFCEYRYIYGLVTCVPLYLVLALEGELTYDHI